ncbi:MAG: hypothetical protein ABH859_08135 [Pseudomonadota bacterium]
MKDWYESSINRLKINKNFNQRSRLEIVLVSLLIILALTITAGYRGKCNEIENGQILIYDLAQLRSAVILYKTLNQQLPLDLPSLTKLTYEFTPGQLRPYLNNFRFDGQGRLIDPFGTPYGYDVNKGFVYSQTHGFKNF